MAGWLGRRRIGGEAGASAVEYALIASLIAAVIVGTVLALGLEVDALFARARDAFP